MRKGDRLPVALMLLALLLVLLNIVEELPSPRVWLSRFFTPTQLAITSFVRNLGNAKVYFQELEVLRKENELLKRKVEDLTVQLVALQEVVIENENLRRQLEFAASHRALGLQGADVRGMVAGQGPGNLIRAITIDVGRGAGLLPDMPVVTARGLVGRVIEVDASSSKVMLITDARSAVAGLVQRTRATGVVKGQIDGSLVMEGISRDADVEVGDIVLTSGLGGVFPRGVVIGQVVEVRRSDTAIFQEAVIAPSAQLNSLDVVLVVTEPAGEPGSNGSD